MHWRQEIIANQKKLDEMWTLDEEYQKKQKED